MAPSREVLLTGSVPLRPAEKVSKPWRGISAVRRRGFPMASRSVGPRRRAALSSAIYSHNPKSAEAARTLFKERDALGVTEFAFYCARTGFLQRNRAALSDFFEDMVRATRWMLAPENRAEATHMLADVTKQSSDVLATYYLLPGENVYRDPDARPDVEALQHNLDAMEELGSIHSRLDVAKHTDLSFIDAAAARLKPPSAAKPASP